MLEPKPLGASIDGSYYNRLSPVKENYLLCLCTLREDLRVPTVTELTERLKELPPTEGLGTTMPSIAAMVRRMQNQGLVIIGPDKKIRLTTNGLEEGEDILGRCPSCC